MKQFLDKNPFFKSTFWILSGLFLLSVVIRVPSLNRDLSIHHEGGTAQVMRILQSWDAMGITHYQFKPVMNYPGLSNSWINNHASGSDLIHDSKGNYYYISHPPLAYYLPYAFMKLFQLPIKLWSLQLFNLLLHFLCGLFIYMTVLLLAIHHGRGVTYKPGVIAFCVYLFNPATLWFQSNVYMSDTVIQFFFVASVYTLLKLWMRGKFYNGKYLFFYSLLVFLMNYTHWMGLIFSLVVLIYSLNKIRFERRHWNIILATAIFTILAWALTIWQYSGIAGLDALLAEWKQRFFIRSGIIDGEPLNGTIHNYFWYVIRLFFNYLVNYGILYLMVAIIFWRALARKKSRIVFSLNGYRFLILSGFCVVGFHLLLLNYSAHDFTVLYASVFLSVLSGMMYDKMKFTRFYAKGLLNGLVYLSLFLMVAQFLVINNVLGHQDGKKQQTFGKQIAEKSEAGETIFILSDEKSHFEPDAIDVYYAGRNLKLIQDEEEAILFLQKQSNNRARIFTVNGDRVIQNITPLEETKNTLP